MSILYESRRTALDASGNPYSGAKLTVYDAGTTTPASLWATSSLSGGAALSNPVTADSAGVFPQIFTAENAIFDTLLKTSGGVLIRAEEDVVALGANSGSFTRDFTNSRFAVRGSGGTVYVEAGDPTGDDTGGTGVLGGWNGTQADAWAINAVAVNVTGKFTEGGKKLDGTVYTPATAFSGATVDISLPNDPSGCLAWEIAFWDVITSGSASLRARLAYAGGAIKSGATDYAWTQHADDGTNTTAFASRDDSDAQIVMNYALNGTAAFPMSGLIRVLTSSTGNTTVFGQVAGAGGTYPQTGHFTGFGLNTYGIATTLRLLLNAGSFTSGNYRVRPLRGFGET